MVLGFTNHNSAVDDNGEFWINRMVSRGNLLYWRLGGGGVAARPSSSPIGWGGMWHLAVNYVS